MEPKNVHRIDWQYEIVFGFSTLIILFILFTASLYATALSGINLPGSLENSSIFILTFGRYILLPLGIINLILSVYFFQGRPKSTRSMGIITGILGLLAGLFLWLLIFLAQAGLFG